MHTALLVVFAALSFSDLAVGAFLMFMPSSDKNRRIMRYGFSQNLNLAFRAVTKLGYHP
jgi:hypothetical protein